MDSSIEDRFQECIESMKKQLNAGNVSKALRWAEAAQRIRHSDKLVKRISKMKLYLDQLESDDMERLAPGFFVQKAIAGKLYGYQKEGLLWMFGLHNENKGGILGDDMGLGKTAQIVVFLASMFDMDKIKSAMIVLPMSLIATWTAEFEKWVDIRVDNYHGATRSQREAILLNVRRKGGIILVTYGLLATDAVENLRAHVWDYLILDEGHKIKNPTKCTKGAHSIPSSHRIVLTGTPVQNNLLELWSLFDFAHKGCLLGPQKTFKMEFEAPIKRSREKDSTAGEKRLGSEMALALRKTIDPYFLRRTKAQVMGPANKENKGGDHVLRPKALGRKNDFVVWTYLSSKQIQIYQDFLSQDSVKAVLMTTRSPLVQINVMKKICDHPRLLNAGAYQTLGLDDLNEHTDGPVIDYDHVSDKDLMEESGKMNFMIKLLQNIKKEEHRCLVFSQSRRILDIAQRLLSGVGIKCLRIDGLVKSSAERHEIIRRFDSRPKYTVLLLTSQVGGVGLTITSADRVIIFDPSWNPATDSQAIDRCYRIGQKKPVIVYRLITCGTVEEKIYRRQVFKHSLHKQTTEGDKNPFRYFRNQELYELFTLDNTRHSTTQVQLEKMHSSNRNTDAELDEHIARLYSFDIFGISDHDLLFTIAATDENDHENDDQARAYITAKVNRAQELLLASQMQNLNISAIDGELSPVHKPSVAVKPLSKLKSSKAPPPPTSTISSSSSSSSSSEESNEDSTKGTSEDRSLELFQVEEPRPPSRQLPVEDLRGLNVDDDDVGSLFAEDTLDEASSSIVTEASDDVVVVSESEAETSMDHEREEAKKNRRKSMLFNLQSHVIVDDVDEDENVIDGDKENAVVPAEEAKKKGRKSKIFDDRSNDIVQNVEDADDDIDKTTEDIEITDKHDSYRGSGTEGETSTSEDELTGEYFTEDESGHEYLPSEEEESEPEVIKKRPLKARQVIESDSE